MKVEPPGTNQGGVFLPAHQTLDVRLRYSPGASGSDGNSGRLQDYRAEGALVVTYHNGEQQVRLRML
jgi:hypothetical protein